MNKELIITMQKALIKEYNRTIPEFLQHTLNKEWKLEITNITKDTTYFIVSTPSKAFFVKMYIDNISQATCSCKKLNCKHISFILSFAAENIEEFSVSFSSNKNEINSYLKKEILEYYPPRSYYLSFSNYSKIEKDMMKSKDEWFEFGKDYFFYITEYTSEAVYYTFSIDYSGTFQNNSITIFSDKFERDEKQAISERLKGHINFKTYKNIKNCKKFTKLATEIREAILENIKKPKVEKDFLADYGCKIKSKKVAIPTLYNKSSIFRKLLSDIDFSDQNSETKPKALIGYEYVESEYFDSYFKPFLNKILKSGKISKSPLNTSQSNFDKLDVINLSSIQKEYCLNFEKVKKIHWNLDHFSQSSFIAVLRELDTIGRNRIFIKNSDEKLENLSIINAKYIKIIPKFLDEQGTKMSVSVLCKKVKNDNWTSILKIGFINSEEYYIRDQQTNDLIFFDRDNLSIKNLFSIFNELSEFSKDDFNDAINILKEIEEKDPEHFVVDKKFPKLTIIKVKPEVILTIVDEYISNELIIKLNFKKDDIIKKSIDDNIGDYSSVVVEDEEFKESVFNFLCNEESLILDNSSRKEKNFVILKESVNEWLKSTGVLLLKKGFSLFFEKDKRKIDKVSNVNISTKTNIKWFEYELELEDSSGSLVKIKDFDFNTQTAVDDNGIIHIIDEKDLGRVQRLIKYGEKTRDGFRVPASNFVLINELYDKREDNITKELQINIDKAKKLEKFKNINYKAPKNFNGTLRKYQLAGYQWLRFLNEYNFSGCLADDMGLGKTVQTLSLLQYLKNTKKLGKILLIVPVSAIPNWENEITKFTNNITHSRYIGSDRNHKVIDKFDIVITSYATLRNDIEYFQNMVFHYVILDESQNIKNFKSQTTKAIKLLKSENKLALSGTPIENNLMELWSLYDFLIPGYLGTNHWFKLNYTSMDDGSVSNDKILKKMIYPFMLRRKKDEVEIDLPPKNEVIISVEMGEEQQDLYTQVAKHYRDVVTNKIKSDDLDKSSMQVLEGMLRLRQICLFPGIIDKKYSEVPSAKFDEFSDMITDVIDEGHKVLFFSQFVEVLTRVEKHLIKNKIKYSYIDGSTTLKNRAKMIDNFQNDEKTQVFLLSIKAGGVALNLTAADYVFIYDPWWNPAVENQAVDRAHRYGQKKSVFVYRFIVKDTIEEKIIKLQNMKKNLVENIVTSDKGAFKSLSKDDILGLFDG